MLHLFVYVGTLLQYMTEQDITQLKKDIAFYMRGFLDVEDGYWEPYKEVGMTNDGATITTPDGRKFQMQLVEFPATGDSHVSSLGLTKDIMFLDAQAHQSHVDFQTIQVNLKTFDGIPTSESFDSDMEYPECIWKREQWLLYISFCAYQTFLTGDVCYRNMVMEKALRFFPNEEINTAYNVMLEGNPKLLEFYNVFSKLSTKALMAVGY